MIESELPRRPDGSTVLGIVADTHCRAGGIALPDAVLEAFRGVDSILHLGDMGEAAVLDRLAAVAPVLATRGGDDPPHEPRIVAGGRVLAAADLALVAAFELGELVPGAKSQGLELPREPLLALLDGRLRRPVGAVLFAGTHAPVLAMRDGLLLLNPGSATLPVTRGPSGLGTVARLTIRGSALFPEIVQL